MSNLKLKLEISHDYWLFYFKYYLIYIDILYISIFCTFILNEIRNKKTWKLRKLVLPQHTDHAGVMWHGAYLNLLEEARIDALNKVGISYSQLSNQGFEIPVVSLEIKYKLAFKHGENIQLKSEFNIVNKIRLKCHTLFLKDEGNIAASSVVNLVLVSKKFDSIQIVRKLPKEIMDVFSLLQEGPQS